MLLLDLLVIFPLQVCFAYRGKLQNFFKLGFSYKNNKGATVDNQYAYPSVTFKQSPGYRTQLAFGF